MAPGVGQSAGEVRLARPAGTVEDQRVIGGRPFVEDAGDGGLHQVVFRPGEELSQDSPAALILLGTGMARHRLPLQRDCYETVGHLGFMPAKLDHGPLPQRAGSPAFAKARIIAEMEAGYEVSRRRWKAEKWPPQSPGGIMLNRRQAASDGGREVAACSRAGIGYTDATVAIERTGLRLAHGPGSDTLRRLRISAAKELRLAHGPGSDTLCWTDRLVDWRCGLLTGRDRIH